MPADTFAHSVPVAASPETVMALLQDAATWKGIGPIDEVRNAVHDDAGLVSFTWTARAAGRSWEGTARRSDALPSQMTLELDSPEIGGTITVGATRTADQTVLAVELFARSKGMLSGLFWGVVSDALRRGLPHQVELFAAQF